MSTLTRSRSRSRYWYSFYRHPTCCWLNKHFSSISRIRSISSNNFETATSEDDLAGLKGIWSWAENQPSTSTLYSFGTMFAQQMSRCFTQIGGVQNCIGASRTFGLAFLYMIEVDYSILVPLRFRPVHCATIFDDVI